MTRTDSKNHREAVQIAPQPPRAVFRAILPPETHAAFACALLIAHATFVTDVVRAARAFAAAV
eukprot:CAMPEP_0179488576 /NCGR_PEP_ID=MMETSP0799-20121207/64170_1 /TAXON_ID=46947 /ORGANISM="Geminigera cryophila, Strain CCMP2564" /LENGTH=62 /DNA_ID=CAMNT_0021304053 /DNA_START=1025 /DNA_END=1213 /DNA_ORIENTATION=-